ncbi:MAG: hypothetical protein ACLFPQ_03240 [Candidatus Woesearchaeota archaeon]
MATFALKDWITQRIKHQDLFTGKLKKINEKTEFHLVAEYKDKDSEIIITSKLDPKELKSIKDKQAIIEIITFNTKANFNHLLKEWKEYIKHDNLKIFFVNTKIHHDNFWVIKPKVHDMITEKTNLKKGLESLFNSVEAYD